MVLGRPSWVRFAKMRFRTSLSPPARYPLAHLLGSQYGFPGKRPQELYLANSARTAETAKPQIPSMIRNVAIRTLLDKFMESQVALCNAFDRVLPAKFRVDEVIPGWTEVLQLMTPGARWRVWIPAEQAYGEDPQGGQPAGDLTFEIELIEIL